MDLALLQSLMAHFTRKIPKFLQKMGVGKYDSASLRGGGPNRSFVPGVRGGCVLSVVAQCIFVYMWCSVVQCRVVSCRVV